MCRRLHRLPELQARLRGKFGIQILVLKGFRLLYTPLLYSIGRDILMLTGKMALDRKSIFLFYLRGFCKRIIFGSETIYLGCILPFKEILTKLMIYK